MMVFISNGKLHVSAYSGHHQFLTPFLLYKFYIICLNRVAMLRSHHHYHLRAFAKLSLVGSITSSDVQSNTTSLTNIFIDLGLHVSIH